ncbi:hypothetical protein [Mangrovicoccus sp. HB161399]|uniref:hypothetical protein n=1 Tax=Mangrovicoccus sp. HB161399 TaxID=2720392 RepID=UPI001552862E|nr:hypothetical protein [Mangrovicoccus sp. HB161399]
MSLGNFHHIRDTTRTTRWGQFTLANLTKGYYAFHGETRKMYRHEAIEYCLLQAGCPMTFSEIAAKFETEEHYPREKGRRAPQEWQVKLRVKNYPKLFSVVDGKVFPVERFTAA